MIREQVDPTPEERQRAAMAYLVWPVAVLDLLQARNATRWFQLHLRQAALLGVAASSIIVVVMLLPLVIVLLLNDPNAGTIEWIYTPGFLCDFVLSIGAFGYAIRLSARAARGEHIEVPYIWSIVSRGLVSPR